MPDISSQLESLALNQETSTKKRKKRKKKSKQQAGENVNLNSGLTNGNNNNVNPREYRPVSSNDTTESNSEAGSSGDIPEFEIEINRNIAGATGTSQEATTSNKKKKKKNKKLRVTDENTAPENDTDNNGNEATFNRSDQREGAIGGTEKRNEAVNKDPGSFKGKNSTEINQQKEKSNQGNVQSANGANKIKGLSANGANKINGRSANEENKVNGRSVNEDNKINGRSATEDNKVNRRSANVNNHVKQCRCQCQCSRPKQSNKSNNGNSSRKSANGSPTDEKPVCNFCRKIGHLQRNCRSFLKSRKQQLLREEANEEDKHTYLPIVKTRIPGVKRNLSSLLKIDCTGSLICESIVKDKHWETPNSQCQGNEGPINCLGLVTQEISIGSKRYRLPFFVVKDTCIPLDIVLGMNFLGHFKWSLEAKPTRVKIEGEEVEVVKRELAFFNF